MNKTSIITITLIAGFSFTTLSQEGGRGNRDRENRQPIVNNFYGGNAKPDQSPEEKEAEEAAKAAKAAKAKEDAWKAKVEENKRLAKEVYRNRDRSKGIETKDDELTRCINYANDDNNPLQGYYQYKLGKHFYESGDNVQALEWFKRSVVNGSVEGNDWVRRLTGKKMTVIKKEPKKNVSSKVNEILNRVDK